MRVVLPAAVRTSKGRFPAITVEVDILERMEAGA